MTLKRKLILGGAAVVLAAAGWYAYRVYFVASHLREAYAAWDTGTLLESYVQTHDHRWPTSWDDLLTVMDAPGGDRLMLRGASAGDRAYANRLREHVAVNWRFDPARPGQPGPVSRLDGSAFPVLWIDPNDMVREALARPTTSPSTPD